MEIKTRYDLNNHIFVIVFQGGWVYIEGDIIALHVVHDQMGIHENYIINTNPNIFWNLDDIYPSVEDVITECEKRNSKT